MHLSRLFVYPIKSARGIEVTHANLDERGLEHDRRWMVVDARGVAITARTHPRLLRVETALRGTGRGTGHATELEIGYASLPTLRVPLTPPVDAENVRTVRVWADTMPGVDMGASAATWFSTLLEQPASLVWMPPSSARRMNPAFGPARLSFADGNPLHLVSESSLRDLSARVGQPLAVERFRPNLVVADAAPYAEDTWGALRLGEVRLQRHEPCARCMMVNLEPDSAGLGVEPLRTLARYRRNGKAVNFGQHLHVVSGSELAVGTKLELL